jgi:hypothetical protein
MPISGYEEWENAKYWTAPGTRRNAIWMGHDAAVAYWANEPQRHSRWCAVMEGPLDAGRLGPPCLPLLGKSMSAEQASLLEAKFGRIVVIRDNDEAGEKSEKNIRAALATRDVRFDFMVLPRNFKDPGEIPPELVTFVRSLIVRRAASL